MPKRTKSIESVKPLKGRQHTADRSNFSIKSGIEKLMHELGGEDANGHAKMQISSLAKNAVNGLAMTFLEKMAHAGLSARAAYTTDTGRDATKNGTLTPRDVKFAARFVIKDDKLRGLSDDNVNRCTTESCTVGQYSKNRLDETDFKDALKVYGAGRRTESNPNGTLVLSPPYIKLFLTSFMGSFRSGKDTGMKALTVRLQHIIGELLGMAITTAQEAGDKRVDSRHLQVVLMMDEGLRDVFQGTDLKQTPAQAIGAGIVKDER